MWEIYLFVLSFGVWFNGFRSSRFARLQGIQCAMAGKNVYLRFTCSTGDAMGMNMVSKGVQNVLDFLQTDFPDMDVIGISGNFFIFPFLMNNISWIFLLSNRVMSPMPFLCMLLHIVYLSSFFSVLISFIVKLVHLHYVFSSRIIFDVLAFTFIHAHTHCRYWQFEQETSVL